MTEPLKIVGELPASTRQRRNGPHQVTLDRAAQLRASEGQWAEWPTKVAATALRKTLATCGPGFEVELVDGKPYVRWVNPETAEPTSAPPVEAEDIWGKVDDDGAVCRKYPQHPGRCKFLPAESSGVDPNAWSPKVKCFGCDEYLPIDDGDTPEATKAKHYLASPDCKRKAAESSRNGSRLPEAAANDLRAGAR